MIYLDYVSLGILEGLSKKSTIKDMTAAYSNPVFTTSDTGLSHRKVNELSSTGVIQDDRKNKMAWRKFGVTDVTLVKLADELVAYGFNKNSQVKGVLDFMVNNGIEIAQQSDKKKLCQFSAILICNILTMSDIPSYLVLTKNSIIGVFDFAEYKLWIDDNDNISPQYLTIRLDQIIKPILKEIDTRLVTKKPNNRRITELPISSLQLKALQLIHSGNFSKIELRLGDGDIGVVKAFDYTTIKKGEKSAAEIGNIVMKMGKHHTVTVYADDGNTITLQKTRTFKD